MSHKTRLVESPVHPGVFAVRCTCGFAQAPYNHSNAELVARTHERFATLLEALQARPQ